MTSFKDFCKRYASDEVLHIEEAATPLLYAEATANVIMNIKNQVEVFDKVPVNYIQETLETNRDLDSVLRITNGDIPDGVINEVSMGLYNKNFNDCDSDEQSIIKTVSIYICIATNLKEDFS